MYRRYLPLENWEWNAVRQQLEAVDPVMRKLLPALLQAEVLLRRSVFAGCSAKSRSERTSPHLEHRLYALFAE